MRHLIDASLLKSTSCRYRRGSEKMVACEESDSSEKGEADLRRQRNRLEWDGTRLEVEREAGVRFSVHQQHRVLLFELCTLLVREAGRELQTPLEALLQAPDEADRHALFEVVHRRVQVEDLHHLADRQPRAHVEQRVCIFIAVRTLLRLQQLARLYDWLQMWRSTGVFQAIVSNPVFQISNIIPIAWEEKAKRAHLCLVLHSTLGFIHTKPKAIDST